MKRFLLPAALLLVVLVGALLLADAPLFVHYDAPAALTPSTRLYLDRAYRLEGVPAELEGAVAIPVHRHARRPVHVRFEEAATVYLFHVDREPRWSGWTRAPFVVRLPGADAQLTTAWSKRFEPGTHAIDPAGHGAASPIVVVGGGAVREVESFASLLRRADHATRGVSRLVPAGLVALAGVLVAVALVLAGARLKPKS